MSPFGSTYRWRTTMNTITYYAMRRTLGAVAKLLDRMDRRERERRAQLRAHREDVREGQHHSQRSQDAPGAPGAPETTTSSPDMAISPHRAEQDTP